MIEHNDRRKIDAKTPPGEGSRRHCAPGGLVPGAETGIATESKTSTTKGQALVEFTLVILMMLFMLIGIAEFGRAWMTRNILTGASREAVRIAAVQGDVAAARGRADAILASAGIVGASVGVNPSGAPFGTCTVNVTYNFPLSVAGFLPGLSGSSIPLAATTSMREEY